MSSRIPEDLSRLDDSARLRTFDTPLLDSTPDPELQRLVNEASAVSGFPIALVSLVVSRIQFFRAQVGLPPELEAAQATDRCTSFCQFVVAADQPLEVEDASREPKLPRDLVERYGIRAYAGFPLRVGGQTVGSFCVIDAKPARLEAPVLARLEALALEASARLEALAKQWAPAQGGDEAHAHEAWMAVAETQPLLSLSAQFAAGRLSLEQFQRALGSLAGVAGTLTVEGGQSQRSSG